MDFVRALLRNLISSFIDKIIIILNQFFTILLMGRFLPREVYGEWGIALSLFVFIHFFNMSGEAILYREHKNIEKDESSIMAGMISFSAIKTVVFLLIAAGLSFFYSSTELRWALMAMGCLMGGEAMIASLQTFLIIKMRQDIVAKINGFKGIISLIFLFGLLLFPSLQYIFYKELFTAIIIFAVYLFSVSKLFHFRVKDLLIRLGNWNYVWRGLWNYSFWVHLIGVTTNFIYKADIFFLSLFCPLAIVGNYTLALNSANFANILPALLGQQASVALGHLQDKEKSLRLTHLFIRWSIILSVLTMLGFWILGKWYLRMVSGGENISQMFFYLLCIVGGLVLVKSVASPLVAYLNILGDVKKLFWRVNLPLLLIASASYYFSAKIWGDIGVAYANIFNSLIWVLLVLVQAHREGFCWKGFCTFNSEYQIISRWRKGNGS